MKKFTMAFITVAALFLSGCISGLLEPKEDPTKFYVLTPSANIAQQNASFKAYLLGISLPSYAMRSQIVSFADNGELIISDENRWGEPLSDGVLRTVYSDLRAAFSKNGKISAYSYESFPNSQNSIKISIFELGGKLGGKVAIKSNWSLLDAKGAVLSSGVFDASANCKDSYESYVSALSSLVNDMAKDVIAKISKTKGM